MKLPFSRLTNLFGLGKKDNASNPKQDLNYVLVKEQYIAIEKAKITKKITKRRKETFETDSRKLIRILQKNRRKNPSFSYSKEFRTFFKKRIGKDVKVSTHLLLEVQICENCGAPVNYKRFLTGSVELSCVCEYCDREIFKDFVIYFPEKGEYNYASVERNILTLQYREYQR